jgi:hypothetical protein
VGTKSDMLYLIDFVAEGVASGIIRNWQSIALAAGVVMVAVVIVRGTMTVFDRKYK